LYRYDDFNTETVTRVQAFAGFMAEFRQLGARLLSTADQLSARLDEQRVMTERLIRAIKERQLWPHRERSNNQAFGTAKLIGTTPLPGSC
jgi:hypothetical protein